MKKRVIIPVFLCVLLLSGCAGYREIDSEYLISAIAFKQVKDGFTVYAEVRSISAADKDSQSELFYADGKTPYEAMNNMAALLPKKAVLDHCGTAIIDTQATKKGFKAIMDYLYDAKNLNLGIFLFAADDAKEILSCRSQAISIGYDIMSIQDNLEKTSGVKFKNKYYEIVSGHIANGGFCLPEISVKEDGPVISGQIIYDGYLPAAKLNYRQAVLYNILASGSSGGEINLSGEQCKVNKITADVVKEGHTLCAKICFSYRAGGGELNGKIKDEVSDLLEGLNGTGSLRPLGIKNASGIERVEVIVGEK